jgi:DnaJ family protein A protein 5
MGILANFLMNWFQNLVAFIRKRDPRYKAYQDALKAKKEAQMAENKAKALRERQELQAKAAAYKAQEWARAGEESDSLSESEDDSAYPNEEFYCVACNKYFKSERQFHNHEQSKKHLKVVQDLREQMLAEENDLDLQAIPLNAEEDEIEESIEVEAAIEETVIEVKTTISSGEEEGEDIPMNMTAKKSKKKSKKKAPKWGYDGEDISESSTPNVDKELEDEDLSTLVARLALEQSGRRKKGSRAHTPRQGNSDDESSSSKGITKSEDGVDSDNLSNAESAPVKESAKAKREKRKEKKKQKEEAEAAEVSAMSQPVSLSLTCIY